MNAEIDELPFEIQLLIVKVVKRTRLRKAERADIERELTAHFRDGLASGKSIVQLVDAFGEARVSAKSIRAGAIAKRPPLDRALRQASFIVGWACAALLVFYAGSIGYLWMQAPVIRFNALERYHATLPKVAEQGRAWPIYKQGLIALADTDEDRSRPDYPLGSEWHNKGLRFRSYGEEDGQAIPIQTSWAIQSKVLRERRDGIDTLVRAASMPALGYVPCYGNNAEDDDIGYYYPHSWGNEPRYFGQILLPNLSILRFASRFLGTDALMSIESGDGDRFVRDIEAMIQISHHAEEGQFVVSQLSGTSIRDRAFTRIIMAMEWRPEALNDDHLRQLAEILRRIPASDADLDIANEPWMFQDFIQHTYTDNGSGDGVFNPVYGTAYLRLLPSYKWPPGVPPGSDSPDLMDRSVRAPASAFTNASRKEVTDLYDMMICKTQEQAQRPLWQQDYAFENEIARTLWGDNRRHDWGDYYGVDDVSGPSKWTIPRMLIRTLSNAAMNRKLGASQCHAAQTAIALTQYRRAHGGAWPARLDELVPAYLGTVPPDPWTGKPINYELRDGHPYVWSVGMQQKAGNGDSEAPFPGWKNVADIKISKHWLWFLGDNKLERWKPAE